MSSPSQPGPFEREDVVARYESWYATPYGRIADRIERELILELLAPLGPGSSVLEIGCGTAHFSAFLAQAGFRVTGVDPSLSMLSRARERVPAVCADGLCLPFADRAFDGAFAISVLEFVPDPEQFLREACRVTRGPVAVLAISRHSWLGLRRRLSGRLGHPIFSKARFHTRSELASLVVRAGARVERTRSALFLPPALAGRWPALEQRMSRSSFPGGGLLGWRLAATAPKGT
ncbi:MAG: methyltransferase domain-containing protein [Planctomycetes bacterium]|nr:methyltransferase domain-containing protein [Planctomycetota bacterium]